MVPRPVGPYYVIYGRSEEWSDDEDGVERLESVSHWIIGITTQDKLSEHIAQVEERVRGYVSVYAEQINEFFEWQNTDEIFK